MTTFQSAVQTLAYEPAEVAVNCKLIYDKMLSDSPHIRCGNFERISSTDLEFMFELYDEHAFAGLLSDLLLETDAMPIRFEASTRMTRNGGRVKRLRPRGKPSEPFRYEIAIAVDLLAQGFRDDQREISVGGIACRDRLEAMQRIFEHELIHLVEFLCWNESSCKQRRFRALADNIFDHREFSHQLITRAERARVAHGIQVGDFVEFDFRGSRLTGVVGRVTKRATVFVENEEGPQYSDGRRYMKYYIPIPWLRRTDDPLPQ